MKRAIILTLVLGLGLSAIFVMPDFKQAECALDTEIPDFINGGRTAKYTASDKELAILASDTAFAKAKCLIPREEEKSYITMESPMDLIDLSIVLSGYDLANSIHRPERCMPAQGHKIISSQTAELELNNGESIPLTRLVSKLTVMVGPPEDQKHVTYDSLTYYFFVGNREITNSHTERTLIDIKDRVLLGKAQRWAYVSASMQFVEQVDPPFGAPPTLEKADKKIRELLKELAERNIDWEDVKA